MGKNGCCLAPQFWDAPRAVRVEDLPEAIARTQMLRTMPAPMVESILALMRQGPSSAALAVRTAEPITGRAPRTFAEWANTHRTAFE